MATDTRWANAWLPSAASTTTTRKGYVTVMHRCGCAFSSWYGNDAPVAEHRIRAHHRRLGTRALIFRATEPGDWHCPDHGDVCP